MQYLYEASQTIHKIVEIEAKSEDEAFEEGQRRLEEGEIRFDDGPWMDMEVNYSRLEP